MDRNRPERIVSSPYDHRADRRASLPDLLLGPNGRSIGPVAQAQPKPVPHLPGQHLCLTFPEWGAVKPAEPIPALAEHIICASVVPSPAVGRLDLEAGRQYARVGGLLREHIGGRRFRGTLSVIYEVSGQAIGFEPAKPGTDAFWTFRQVPGEGTICLW